MDLSNADDEKSEGGGSTAKTVVEKTFGGDQWVMSQHVSVKSATSPPRRCQRATHDIRVLLTRVD